LEYVEKALNLSKKLFGREDLSYELAKIYINAGTVYEHCNRNDEALSLYKKCLEMTELVFGDNPHPGKKRRYSSV
jgi:tetratricopeptide (TPR) repeat protein